MRKQYRDNEYENDLDRLERKALKAQIEDSRTNKSHLALNIILGFFAFGTLLIGAMQIFLTARPTTVIIASMPQESVQVVSSEADIALSSNYVDKDESTSNNQDKPIGSVQNSQAPTVPEGSSTVEIVPPPPVNPSDVIAEAMFSHYVTYIDAINSNDISLVNGASKKYLATISKYGLAGENLDYYFRFKEMRFDLDTLKIIPQDASNQTIAEFEANFVFDYAKREAPDIWKSGSNVLQCQMILVENEWFVNQTLELKKREDQIIEGNLKIISNS